jgi:hypothetical protein
MIRLLTTVAKATGLTYSILSSVVLIGLLAHGVIKHARRQRSGS